MTEQEIIQKLRERMNRMTFIIGFMTPVVMAYNPLTQAQKDQVQWIMKAIEEVVYKDNPLPARPQE